MNDFFWSSGHLGWGIFALLSFSALWWLLCDLVWRLSRYRIGLLATAMFSGWIIGVLATLLGYYLGHK